jgi:hypothetical protein
MYFSNQEVSDFWNGLAPYWGRGPGLIKKPFSKPFVSEREFFAILTKWAQEAHNGKKSVDVAMIDADALPSSNHQTLAATEKHIADRWDKDWYLYLPDGIQQYNGDVWERSVELLVPAIRSQGGLPSGGMTLELFFGKYKSTPTGIHLDSSDNLAFVTRGPKRLIFWPPDRFAVKYSTPPNNPKHQRALIARYEDHLRNALVIDAEAGDVVYWPKDYWHIGASQNTWSGMVTIPMWWTAKPSSLARTMLLGALDVDSDPQLYSVDADMLTAAALDIPPALHDVVTRMKSQLSTKLELTAKVAWAKFVTSFGFGTPPALLPVPNVTNITRVRVKYPIVSVPLGRVHVVVGCGHSTLVHLKPLSEVVSHLRVGSEHTVAGLHKLLREPNVGCDPIAKLVGELVAFRALEVL